MKKRQYIYKFNSKNKEAVVNTGVDNYMNGKNHGSS